MWYWASCIGALLCIVVIIAVSTNIAYHFIKLSHQSKPQQTRTNYVLFLLLSTISMFISIIFAFVRTNRLTRQNPHFSMTQCAIGYYGAYCPVIILSALKYAFLLHRVQSAFRGSVYEYSSKTYRALNGFLIPLVMIQLILMFITYDQTAFSLHHFQSQHIVFCAGISRNSHDFKRISDVIGVVTLITSQSVYDVVLLYMFTSPLSAMKSQMIASHLRELQIVSKQSQDIVSDFPRAQKSDSPNSPNSPSSVNGAKSPTAPKLDKIQSVEPMDIAFQSSISSKSYSKTLTVEDVASEIRMGCTSNKASAQRIMGLYSLIQKYFILTLIMVIANMLWLILWIAVSEQFIQLIMYPLTVQLLCIWFMFCSSEKYWKMVVPCCVICFCGNERDINGRFCCLF